MNGLEPNKAYEVNISMHSDGSLRLFAVVPEEGGIGLMRLKLVDITDTIKRQLGNSILVEDH